ncbi:MAG: metallophosphoesterase [Deltaproteobacteria bacterium]|jgi:predicted MPP superfamily phosphohydrolase|nr:metallophosphoesterase [Deltaproteobacteria bacterium]
MLIACLIVLAFASWFLPFRYKRFFKLKKTWPWSLAVAVLLVGYFALLMSGIYTQPNAVVAVSFNILGLFSIFVLYLLAVTLVGAPVLSYLGLKIFKKKSPCSVGVLCLAVAFGFVALGWVQAQEFKVTYHEIEVAGLNKQVSLVHLPDIHLGAQRGEKYLTKIVETVNSLGPDIVLYNGDLVDSNIALRPELFAIFRNVTAEQYFTTGNHEFYVNTNEALDLISKSGLKILRSETALTNGLEIIGLEYMNADQTSTDAHRVNDLFMNVELPKIPRSGLPAILVHHSPVGVSYAAQNEIAAMFSGHTHGGQVFPGMLVVRSRFPFFKGRYQVGKMTLLVSQGAGTFGPWMRLGSFNEIQHVKLIPKKLGS